MKPIQITGVTTGLESHRLRRQFQFGKVVATFSHYIPSSASGQGRIGVSGSLTMDPWSLRGRFEHDCYKIMPLLVHLCRTTTNELLNQDKSARTPPQFWDWIFEQCYLKAKEQWGPDFPKLAVAVALAPIEFAIWDLYGNIHQLPWAHCVSSEFLGAEDDFSSVVHPTPEQVVEILHTIGGKDCLFNLEAEGIAAVNDGLPETVLAEVRAGRFSFLKPKITGSFDFDLARVKEIDRLVAKLQNEHVIGEIGYYFDANGAIPGISWLSRFLDNITNPAHGAKRKIINFEQPFSTDETFQAASRLDSLRGYCDFSIDESLVCVGDVARAQSFGYNRLGVKVCKSVTETLRIIKEAKRLGIKCDMQDLTQIGRGLLVSASVAAWCGLRIESNGGKNVVKAADLFGTLGQITYYGLINIESGHFRTGNLSGPGFSVAKA